MFGRLGVECIPVEQEQALGGGLPGQDITLISDSVVIAHIRLTSFTASFPQLVQHFILDVPPVLEEE